MLNFHMDGWPTVDRLTPVNDTTSTRVRIDCIDRIEIVCGQATINNKETTTSYLGLLANAL